MCSWLEENPCGGYVSIKYLRCVHEILDLSPNTHIKRCEWSHTACDYFLSVATTIFGGVGRKEIVIGIHFMEKRVSTTTKRLQALKTKFNLHVIIIIIRPFQ